MTKGQPVARVGRHAQLHFETYTSGTRRTYQWWKGDAPPSRLLNPTEYLRAAARYIDPTEAPSLPPVLPPPPAGPSSPAFDDPEPVAPVHPVPVLPAQPTPGDGGLLLLALVLLGGGLA